MNTRAMWLVLPAVGLVIGAGCGGPPPEPPAIRAPISVAKPAKVPGKEKAPTAPIAPGRESKLARDEGAAPKGKSATVAAAVSDATKLGDAGELPRARLAHVRPISLADAVKNEPTQPEIKTPWRPSSFMADPLSLVRDPARPSAGEVGGTRLAIREVRGTPLANGQANGTQTASGPSAAPRMASEPSVGPFSPNASSGSTLTVHRFNPMPSDTAQKPIAERPRAAPRPIEEAPSPTEMRAESERIDLALPDRTPELMAVCQRAEALNRHGFELAQRGAIFSARMEYMQSLETIAEALDAQHATHIHQRMLVAGFKAIDEADDFTSHHILAGGELDVAEIVRAHQTTILKREPKQDWSAKGAMGRYLTYAQEQLAAAAGDVPQASAALFGLGKVYSVPPAAHGPPDSTGGAKAVVFHQAALMVDGKNFMAANELGVLLVRFGRLPEARAALLHSLSISPQPVVWQNLAEVHQAMAEYELAAKARQSAEMAANRMGRAGALAAYDVQWVDPATFVRAKPIDADPIKAAPAPAPAAESKSVAGSVLWGTARK
jgi:tetratricopeptide (TPR) repeat protein